MPALEDFTSISIFIASRTRRTSPSSTVSPVATSIYNTFPATPAFTASLPSETFAADFASMPSLTEIS